MKHLICLLAGVLAAPASASVWFTPYDNGDLTFDLIMVCDGDDADANGSLVAGAALEVTVEGCVIQDVYNYKTTAESVVGDWGYGIFPGTITFTGGAPEEIADTGTPVAPASAPDNPGQLGGSSIVLEFGALWDQGVPEAAPNATTVLCTIAVSDYCKVTIRANATRGGVVLLGGGKPSGTNLPVEIDISHGGCWHGSCPCQPYGDASCDGLITAGDIQILLSAWNGAYDACADFNRDGFITAGDVQLILSNWTRGCPEEPGDPES